MSLKVIKAGILDSIQDIGRTGYREYGINPTGSMDLFSGRKANILAGNKAHEAVIELHYPASTFQFTSSASFVLSGADFAAVVNDEFVHNDKLIYVDKNAILRFTSNKLGARCYLSVAGGFQLDSWLNSKSTNFKAGIGGYLGRRLLKDDVIPFNDSARKINYTVPSENTGINVLNDLFILPGNEWDWISQQGKEALLNSEFIISPRSDRMGYSVTGPAITRMNVAELISSPVCFGTIQLLPGGDLIVLMADHQTTGGYPRIACVISAYHKTLAQKKPGDIVTFKMTDIITAENLKIEEEKILRDLLIKSPG